MQAIPHPDNANRAIIMEGAAWTITSTSKCKKSRIRICRLPSRSASFPSPFCIFFPFFFPFLFFLLNLHFFLSFQFNRVGGVFVCGYAPARVVTNSRGSRPNLQCAV